MPSESKWSRRAICKRLWFAAQRGSTSNVKQWLDQKATCKHEPVRLRAIDRALRIAVVNDHRAVVQMLLSAITAIVEPLRLAVGTEWLSLHAHEPNLGLALMLAARYSETCNAHTIDTIHPSVDVTMASIAAPSLSHDYHSSHDNLHNNLQSGGQNKCCIGLGCCTVQLLLAAKASAQWGGGLYGLAPLSLAAQSNNLHTAQLLLDAKADPLWCNDCNATYRYHHPVCSSRHIMEFITSLAMANLLKNAYRDIYEARPPPAPREPRWKDWPGIRAARYLRWREAYEDGRLARAQEQPQEPNQGNRVGNTNEKC